MPQTLEYDSRPEFKKMPEDDLRNEEVRAVLKERKLPHATAVRYLNLYVGFTDWEQHLNTMWQRSKSKDAEKFRQIITATILLPAADRSTYIDPEHPENLLFKMPFYQQLPTRDWFDLFIDTFQKDVHIDGWRVRILGLGVIRPFEWAPMPRQAYNWLYEKAEASGAITDATKANIEERFKNLVEIYGGAVICNIFENHPQTIKNLVNWRTGYFFERNLYNVYKPEQIFAIKKEELAKTNKSLVKTIRIV